MVDTLTREGPTPGDATPSAVVWIDDDRAIVASVGSDREIATCEIQRGTLAESSYLETVIHVIGDRRRVMILGPDAARLALERAYVAIFHRPDRLVDVEPADTVRLEDLIDLARTLAA